MQAYLKIKQSFLNSPEVQRLLNEEKLRGLGALVAVLSYLRGCEGARSNICCLPSLARTWRTKPAVLVSVVTKYGVFRVNDDGDFFCPMLDEVMNIRRDAAAPSASPASGSDDRGQCPASAPDDRGQCGGSARAVPAQCLGSASAGRPQLPDNQGMSRHNNNNYNNNNNKDNDENEDKDDAAHVAAVQTMVVNGLFQNERFLGALQQATGFWVRDSAIMRDQCRRWFLMQLAVKGKRLQGQADAAQYLNNLLRQGQRTRADFVRFYNEDARRRYAREKKT